MTQKQPNPDPEYNPNMPVVGLCPDHIMRMSDEPYLPLGPHEPSDLSYWLQILASTPSPNFKGRTKFMPCAQTMSKYISRLNLNQSRAVSILINGPHCPTPISHRFALAKIICTRLNVYHQNQVVQAILRYMDPVDSSREITIGWKRATVAEHINSNPEGQYSQMDWDTKEKLLKDRLLNNYRAWQTRSIEEIKRLAKEAEDQHTETEKKKADTGRNPPQKETKTPSKRGIATKYSKMGMLMTVLLVLFAATTPIATGELIRMTDNAAFVKIKPAAINSNYAMASRKILLNNWDNAMASLQQTIGAHEKLCSAYHSILQAHERTETEFLVIPFKQPIDEAANECQQRGMQLPEVRNQAQLYEIQTLMDTENMDETPAGIYTKEIEAGYYPKYGAKMISDDMNAEDFVFQKTCIYQKYYHDWKQRNIAENHGTTVWIYQIKGREMGPCPSGKVHKVINKIICQKMKKTELAEFKEKVTKNNHDRCLEDNHRMAQEADITQSLIDNIKQPHQATTAPYIPSQETRRYKRWANLLPVLAVIPSMIDGAARMLHFFADTKNIENLRVQVNLHTDQIKDLQAITAHLEEAVTAIERQIPMIVQKINKMEVQFSNSIHELNLKQLYRDIHNSIYDTVFAYSMAINMAKTGITTETLLPLEDAAHMRHIMMDTHGLDININLDAVISHITHHEDHLQIHYAFPINDQDRKATIYRVIPVPTHTEQGRLWPTISAEYIAITKIGDKFIPLTTEEASTCLRYPTNCQAAAPFQRPTSNECGLSEFFGLENNCTYAETVDKSNYFRTITNITIYSVREKTPLATHCPQAPGAGPEQVFEISGKGLVETQPGCFIATEEATMYPSNGVAAEELTDKNRFLTPSIITLTEAQLDAPNPTNKLVFPEYKARPRELFNNKVQDSQYIPEDWMDTQKSTTNVLIGTTTLCMLFVLLFVLTKLNLCRTGELFQHIIQPFLWSTYEENDEEQGIRNHPEVNIRHHPSDHYRLYNNRPNQPLELEDLTMPENNAVTQNRLTDIARIQPREQQEESHQNQRIHQIQMGAKTSAIQTPEEQQRVTGTRPRSPNWIIDPVNRHKTRSHASSKEVAKIEISGTNHPITKEILETIGKMDKEKAAMLAKKLEEGPKDVTKCNPEAQGATASQE